jgi:glycosyltransferase involved in cell wall biosynthesis
MLHRGDAVGQHTLAVADQLRSAGVDSAIYVELEDPDTVHLTRLATDYPATARPDDVLVYQFATASALADGLAGRPETLVVNYHNVTPPELLASWDNALARHQVEAQRELGRLAGRAVLGVAVSEFNRADLVAAGFVRTEVIPPVVGLSAVARPVTELVAGDDRPRRLGARWLSVGRLAPNKALEDTLDALAAYRRRHDAEATLLVLGRPVLAPYTAALHRWAADLGLADAVHFAGAVSEDRLADAYRDADVLVVSSEHEGFCLPVVEAMAFDLPAVAYRQGAVPDVLGDAGVVVDDKDPVTVADAVARLQTDGRWRAERVAAGRRRLDALDLGTAGPRLVELLLAVAGAPRADRLPA